MRRLGLEPWSDLSPWQKLSISQQRKFNEKYLALPRELQVSNTFCHNSVSRLIAFQKIHMIISYVYHLGVQQIPVYKSSS